MTATITDLSATRTIETRRHQVTITATNPTTGVRISRRHDRPFTLTWPDDTQNTLPPLTADQLIHVIRAVTADATTLDQVTQDMPTAADDAPRVDHVDLGILAASHLDVAVHATSDPTLDPNHPTRGIIIRDGLILGDTSDGWADPTRLFDTTEDAVAWMDRTPGTESMYHLPAVVRRLRKRNVRLMLHATNEAGVSLRVGLPEGFEVWGPNGDRMAFCTNLTVAKLTLAARAVREGWDAWEFQRRGVGRKGEGGDNRKVRLADVLPLMGDLSVQVVIHSKGYPSGERRGSVSRWAVVGWHDGSGEDGDITFGGVDELGNWVTGRGSVSPHPGRR